MGSMTSKTEGGIKPKEETVPVLNKHKHKEDFKYKEEEQRRKMETLRLNSEQKDKERAAKTKQRKNELEKQTRAKIIEILKSKMQMEFQAKMYIMDKSVELANCSHETEGNQEEGANDFISIFQLAERQKVKSGCKHIDNDDCYVTDVTVFRNK